ncbi:MAG: prepilin-type N-terminal cleavage/methylation domain-containing protein [Candidatus Microsaccharimonas sp.]
MKAWAQKSIHTKGFTIVELLIVVVVIAILAAITIVAYNGIQNTANDSAVQSDLSTLSKKIKLNVVKTGDVVTPPDISQDQPTAQDKQVLTNALPFSKESYTRTGTAFLYTISGSEPVFAAVSKSGKVYIYDGSKLRTFDGPWDEDAVLSVLYDATNSLGWSCSVEFYTWSYANGWQSTPEYC